MFLLIVSMQLVDFSWNKHADRKFQFFDSHLVSLICSKSDPDMLEFFKLLSLCHTVMVEQKDGESALEFLNCRSSSKLFHYIIIILLYYYINVYYINHTTC